MEGKSLFTTREAASFLGVSAATIYRMEKKGFISSNRTPGGQRRFSRKILEGYLRKSRNIEAPQNPSRYRKRYLKSKKSSTKYGLVNHEYKWNKTMSIKEVGAELQKVHDEMKSWRELNNPGEAPFHEDEVRRREVFLIKQRILFNIMNAKKERDLSRELFNIGINNVLNFFLNRVQLR